MFLGHEEILRLIRHGSPPLVENVDEYQLLPAEKHPRGVAEGPCVEMRIGRVFAHDAAEAPILSYDFMEAGNDAENIVRYLPPAKTIYDVNDPELGPIGRRFVLRRFESVLLESIETINLPNTDEMSLMCVVEPRFSLARMGVALLKSDADPGYRGRVVVRVVNLGPFETIELALGARVAKMRFVRVAGSSPSYVGRFGGKPGDVLERR